MTSLMPDENALKERIAKFLKHFALLDGDEKGEAQVFLDRFFQALGHEGAKEAGAVLEDRVRGEDSIHFADLMWNDVVLFEMKKRGEDLKRHYAQAERYWLQKTKGRPRYVVTCNFDEFWIYDFEHQMYQPIEIVPTPQLHTRWEAFGFMLPKPIEPLFDQNLEEVSKSAAGSIADMTASLIAAGIDRHRAQRFAMQCVTAMFAEDTALLPRHLFTRAVADSVEGSADAFDVVFGLFREMNSPGKTAGGRFEGTPYFNGDLYADAAGFALPEEALVTLKHVSALDWSKIQPEIFGTLFEQFLDDEQRHSLGAHFTTARDIMRVVRPTIVDPFVERIQRARTQKTLGEIETELTQLKIIDPACGSGNFLYVAYRELRKLETLIEEKRNTLSKRRRVRTDRLALVSPNQFYGIDVDSFAIEIARITLLIAKQLTAFERSGVENPLPLDNLDQNIVVGDALFDSWPEFDICIGNPPYIGRRQLAGLRGPAYVAKLDSEFPEVGGLADYVVYWIRLAHERLSGGGRAGLVCTNSIAQSSSRKHGLDYIIETGGTVTEAVTSMPWSGKAAVTVAIINWTKGPDDRKPILWTDRDTAIEVKEINGSLRQTLDLSGAKGLKSNSRPKVFFQGQTVGNTEAFVLTTEEARALTKEDPASRTVLHPYIIGDEILKTGRPGRWVIDIVAPDATAARAVAPGAYGRLRLRALPEREKKARAEAITNAEIRREHPNARLNWHHRNFLARWWQQSYRRAELFDKVTESDRYIVLSRVASENRRPVFAFVSSENRASDAVQCFSFDDDYSLGILHSTPHQYWFLERCTFLEVRPRYTPTTVFDSFPWPQDPDPGSVQSVANAMRVVLEVRAELTDAGLSLAAQYESLSDPGVNRLRNAHNALDEAVVAAYGFNDREDLVAQLLALNLKVFAEESVGGAVTPPGPPPGVGGTRTTDFFFPAPEL